MPMRDFASPGAFAVFLTQAAAQMARDTERGLTRAAQLVQREAKAAIGEYQPAAPPFGPWPPLAPSTVEQKTRLGYSPPDNPLLRTGDMRDSIEYTVDMRGNDGDAYIGSASDVAEAQELGTRTIPPRSFLGSSAARRADDIARLMSGQAVASLTGDNANVPIPLP